MEPRAAADRVSRLIPTRCPPCGRRSIRPSCSRVASSRMTVTRLTSIDLPTSLRLVVLPPSAMYRSNRMPRTTGVTRPLGESCSSMIGLLCDGSGTKGRLPGIVLVHPVSVATLFEPGVSSRCNLDTACAVKPGVLIRSQSLLNRRELGLGQTARQYNGVFDGLSGTLSHERHHRMSSVAQQYKTALVPAWQGITHVQGRLQDFGAGVESCPGIGVKICIDILKLGDLAGGSPRLERPFRLRGCCEYEDVLSLVERK